MKLSNSNGVNVLINHPNIVVPVQAPAYPKFAPNNRKLVIEKRQPIKKQS